MSVIRSVAHNCFVITIFCIVLCFRLLFGHCLEINDVVIDLIYLFCLMIMLWLL